MISGIRKSSLLSFSINVHYMTRDKLRTNSELNQILGKFRANGDKYECTSVTSSFKDITGEINKANSVREYVSKHTAQFAELSKSKFHASIINDYNGEYLIGVSYINNDKHITSVIKESSDISQTQAVLSAINVMKTMKDIHK